MPSVEARVRAYLERAGLAPETQAVLLPGDASTRRYVRIAVSDPEPRMLLVHPTAIEVATLPFLNVAELLRRMDVRVPHVLGHEADLGILVLEDLGDLTLQDYLNEATRAERWARYTEAVALIDRMQQQGARLASPRYIPFGVAFDVEKLTGELDYFVEHFLIGYRSASLTGEHRSALGDELARVARELAAEPRVFCHRDYHSRNLMWHRGELCVIDFQDARMGPDTYDLVSLLRDCYVDQPDTLIDEMVEEFLRRRPDLARDFTRRFDVMSVQRHLKALGTFGYQTTRGRTRYEDDIPRTLRYLQGVFARHRRFDRLRGLLAPAIPEIA